MSHDQPPPGTVRVRVRTRRHPERRRRRRLVLLGLVLVVVALGITLALLARPLVSAKHEAQEAQADLTSAKSALSHHDYKHARSFVLQAEGHVARARADAGGLGGDVWSRVPVAGTAVDDERHLIDALDQTTTVARIGVAIYPMVSGPSAQLVKGDRVDIPTLREVADRTTSLGPHLDQALADLKKVRGTTPFVGGSIKRATATAVGYLQPLHDSYAQNAPLLRVLPSMVGADGPRTYLLAMLNPSEQRYSGGATLSFATLRLDQGRLAFGKTVNADDLISRGTYQSWQPVRGNTFHHSSAPVRVTNATFSPWWSVSGEELLRGYSKAFPASRYDGLIGTDLQGLADVVALTGPLDVPEVGQVDAANLVKVLAGSYDRFPSVAARHALNASLVPEFRTRFLQGGQMSAKVQALVQSAKGRHFFTYFRDPRIQRLFAGHGLSGDLSTTPYDYVGVFSQNLNGSKVDYWQHRAVTSTVQLRADGSARVQLKVGVTNSSPPYAQAGPDPGVGYFTRVLGTRIGVFLPRDAKFLSATLDGKPLDATPHRPKAAGVVNRTFVQGTMSLDRGSTGTMGVDYRVAHAAQVLSAHAMVYHLDVDPQDLVVPQALRVRVTWPPGYHPSGELPTGWSAAANGATFAGPVGVRRVWAIPLTSD